MIEVRPTALPVERLLLAAAAALALVALVVVVVDDGPDHLDLARAELADDEAFAQSSTAGAAMLRSSVELQEAGTSCDGDRDASCARLLTASAMARVASVRLLDCRRPDIFTFREEFRRYLDDLAAGDDPTPPAPPACD